VERLPVEVEAVRLEMNKNLASVECLKAFRIHMNRFLAEGSYAIPYHQKNGSLSRATLHSHSFNT
jgi:hypothetical protein